MAPDPEPSTGHALPTQTPAPGPPPPLRPEEERTFATLTHLSGLLWVVGVPGIVGVLLVWLLKRDQSAFVDFHGKEALNFQISLILYGAALAGLAVIGFVLMVVLVGFLLFIPAVLASVGLVILQVVTAVLGAVEANRGGYYRYPLTIRLVH